MQFLWAVLGVLLLLFVTLDIIWTTLWVDGGAGPLTNFVTSLIWKSLKKIGPTGKMLEQSGPVILIMTLLTWVTAAWLGWFLLLLFIEDPLINTIDSRPLNRLDLFYFTGTILFTFGNGDYAPSPGIMQILADLLAGYGMIILSLGISYILNVMEGVVGKRTLARDISSIGRTTEEFLTTMYDGSESYDFSSYLNSISSDINHTAIKQQAYPLLNYYHGGNADKSVAYMLPVLADSLFVLKYGLKDGHKIDDPFIKKTMTAIEDYLESMPSDFLNQEDEITPGFPDYECLDRHRLPLLSKKQFIENFRKLKSIRHDLYTVKYESFPQSDE
ncbi:MAG: ion channel [Atopococcus tabaci]|uniref:Ion channel n=1 Tax=Atopococcus tabaci TaxID=269774 RepID=A0AA43UDJ7_9LACT|nr:ion channel [Atopococcus tabaci]